MYFKSPANQNQCFSENSDVTEREPCRDGQRLQIQEDIGVWGKILVALHQEIVGGLYCVCETLL